MRKYLKGVGLLCMDTLSCIHGVGWWHWQSSFDSSISSSKLCWLLCTNRHFNAIVSQIWFWPFWVMLIKLWLKVVHIHQRQNMNWSLAHKFKAINVTFLPKKLASNVQSSCKEKSKWPKSELWHYCIKATKYAYDTNNVPEFCCCCFKCKFFLYISLNMHEISNRYNFLAICVTPVLYLQSSIDTS